MGDLVSTSRTGDATYKLDTSFEFGDDVLDLAYNPGEVLLQSVALLRQAIEREMTAGGWQADGKYRLRVILERPVTRREA